LQKPCCRRFKDWFCGKFCDAKGAQEAIYWNFFVVFYFEATLEIFISILSTQPHLWKPQNVYDYWSVSICWFFVATETIFLVFFVIFLFFPWPAP